MYPGAQDIHSLARAASKRLSIVVAGSSVLRGTLQSLIDALVPKAWESWYKLGSPVVPFTFFFCYGFPYKVATPKKGALIVIWLLGYEGIFRRSAEHSRRGYDGEVLGLAGVPCRAT